MNKPRLLQSNYLYVFGLVLLVTSMPLSKYMTSMAQFVLAAAFLFEGNVIEKFRRFFKNKPALLITSILLLHAIGLLWTTDTGEGLNDIRIKLPLLTLTLMIAGSEPLSKKQFNLVVFFFIGAVFAGTLVSMAVLAGFIYRPITDIREIFIFNISHIRFGLLTCIAIFALFHFIFSENKIKRGLKIVLALLMVWLLVFLLIAESVTGIIILITVSTLLLFYQAFTLNNLRLKILLLVTACAIPALLFFTVRNISKQYYQSKDIPVDTNEKTARGNPYTFDLTQNPVERENGYPVWVYVCDAELREAWNARSDYKYDSLDQRKQYIKYTLIRYLASKGERKDAEAVQNLWLNEVHAIEKGYTNVNYSDISSIRSRILQIVWEYDQFMHSGDPSGHSLMQRLEYWKAATEIIKEHPLIGVGTGDMQPAYNAYYEKTNSKLNPSFWFRAHNQYLSIAVAFGIIGLLYFFFALFAPMLMLKHYFNYFYITFFITALISMISEDTLETQAGATFFAFFNAFFLFARKADDGK